MKTVITYGTFDLFHYGHIQLLKRAKALGDYLIIGLSTDEFNSGKSKTSVHPFQVRKENLEAIKFVENPPLPPARSASGRSAYLYPVNRLRGLSRLAEGEKSSGAATALRGCR